MTSRKTSAEFAGRASGVLAQTTATGLYPRSTPLLVTAFYDIFLSAYAPRGGNGQPIPPFHSVEGRDDWNLLTLDFKWRERGLFRPALKGQIEAFLAKINEGEGLKCYRASDDDGISLSFTHPDHALKTLQYLMSQTVRVSPTTMTTLMRNEFTEIPDCGEEFLKRVGEVYKAGQKGAKYTLSPQELGVMPMKAYASHEDAAAQLALTNIKIKSGFLLIDLDAIANAVATDCGRALPHPHTALH